MKRDLIVKDNVLINASYTLDLTEQRLILLAILEARATNVSTDMDLTIHAESYINHFHVHRIRPTKSLEKPARACLIVDLVMKN